MKSVIVWGSLALLAGCEGPVTAPDHSSIAGPQSQSVLALPATPPLKPEDKRLVTPFERAITPADGVDPGPPHQMSAAEALAFRNHLAQMAHGADQGPSAEPVR